jgi:hypothetical protein
MPGVYFIVQVLCIAILYSTADVIQISSLHTYLQISFWIATVLTFLFYLMTAFRNPGYILGNQSFESAVRLPLLYLTLL